MSLRLETLQVARLAPRLLGESGSLVHAFLLSQLQPDGGFATRAGESDLYYTVFGLDSLLALQAPLPPASAGFVRSFGSGDALDFVHLACLARCWAALPAAQPQPRDRDRLLERLETCRSADGGYHASTGAASGSAYGCFLAIGALQDARADVTGAEAVLRCVDRLRSADGGYANQPDMPAGSTPATTAAVMVQRQLGREPDPAVADWLRARAHPDGGFFAAPGALMPDLLSTATALHALVAMHASIEGVKEPCLDFLDTLWTSRGGFCATWADEALDCEYVYYALLALGHLSL